MSQKAPELVQLTKVQERVLSLFAFLSSQSSADAARVLEISETEVLDAAVELERLGLIARPSPSRSTH